MITKYATSVYVPSSYLVSSFCGKPIIYYPENKRNPKQRPHELKQKVNALDLSLKQKSMKLKNINLQSVKECNIYNNKTINMERIDRFYFDPKKCIISLFPSIIK